jgi:hypothetical protein
VNTRYFVKVLLIYLKAGGRSCNDAVVILITPFFR